MITRKIIHKGSKRRRGRTIVATELTGDLNFGTLSTTVAEYLAASEAEYARWRVALNGYIKNIRVMRCGNEDAPAAHDLYIEVETDYGYVGIVPFEASEQALGCISKTDTEAVISGTWRKRGAKVGHIMNWLESWSWPVGVRVRAVSRNSKFVGDSNEAAVLALATGRTVAEVHELLKAHNTPPAEYPPPNTSFMLVPGSGAPTNRDGSEIVWSIKNYERLGNAWYVNLDGTQYDHYDLDEVMNGSGGRFWHITHKMRVDLDALTKISLPTTLSPDMRTPPRTSR